MFTVLLVVIGIANYCCRKRLADAYADVLSYNELYFVKEELHITRLEPVGTDSVRMVFEGGGIGAMNHFEVYRDSVKVEDRQAPYLTIPASRESTMYGIRVNGKARILFRVEYPDFSTASLPVRQRGLRAVEDWCPERPLSPGDAGAEAVRGVLRDSMGVSVTDSAEGKVLKMARYILAVTAGKYGPPTDSMLRSSLPEQLNCVRVGRSKLQCGDFSRIFCFFSNKAGVPARYITSGADEGGLGNGPHSVNEVWLADHHCWAQVDLTDGIVFVKKGDQYLNTLDLYRLLRYGAEDSSLRAMQYKGDSLTSVPYGKASFFGKNDFNYNNQFAFLYGNYARMAHASGPVDRLRNLFYPGGYYAIYSDRYNAGEWPLYLRVFSAYLLLLVFLCWLVSGLKILQVRSRR